MQEMRQVVRNKMLKFYNENVSSTKSSILSRRQEKMKAPNLIAKLMGLEDFPKFSEKSNVPPIVIMRPQQFPYRERGDQNLISQTSDLLLEEDGSGCTLSENLEPSSVMRVEEEEEEPLQKLNKEASASQKQLKRAVVFKEKKKTGDAKKNGVNERKQTEKNALKSIRIKSEKRRAATNSSAQKRNLNFSMKPAPVSSISSTKKEKISLEKKQIRKLSEVTSSKSSATDSIRKNHKVICEVMPKNYRMGRSLERFEESMRKAYYKPPIKYEVEIKSHLKPLLFTDQSFFNHVHELFGTNFRKPASSHANFSVEHETVNDQLLLDSAKEMITRQTRDGKLSTQQIMQNGTLNRTADRCFGELVDEICNGIKKLESYSEFDDDDDDYYYKDSLDCIVKKDLHCSETMLNAIWDDGWDCWICIEDADEPFVDLVEGILFGLLLELAKDLLSSEKGNV
ncbi:hypothetical protein KSP39_PZI013551 [Platanthera zijinensis]|uniref:DUF3741 domain-containing protein n=1 Tax=Platanthera zijinensis TaxID=2320716 RepID=A0AAP0BCC8_9ASPA